LHLAKPENIGFSPVVLFDKDDYNSEKSFNLINLITPYKYDLGMSSGAATSA
jgi:hypothetical protein